MHIDKYLLKLDFQFSLKIIKDKKKKEIHLIEYVFNLRVLQKYNSYVS